MISRINFLRKYIEHTKVENFEEKQLMYDMLSSVVHAKEYRINKLKEIHI